VIAFSIVIPVYNKEAFIGKTIESVLAQSYVGFELILVNDGSTDNSETIIKAYTNDTRVRLVSQENQGAAAARNRGIAEAKNDYIALLDADDLWYTDHLQTHAKNIQAFPEKELFATNSYLQVGNKKRSRVFSVPTPKKPSLVDFFEASLIDSLINSSTVVIKRSLLDRCGGFDERLTRTEDTDLWVRLAKETQVVFDPKQTVCVVRDSKGLSQKSVAQQHKLKFEKFKDLEAKNPAVKRYLDLNRYALALESRLQGDAQEAAQLSSEVDLKNLNSKQRFLLARGTASLRMLFKIKGILARLGLGLSAYK
jgi:glycosyltransferase involved in cell wall biosynthesis